MRSPSRLRGFAPLACLAVAALLFAARTAPGQNVPAAPAPLSWDALLQCKLVVVARYKSHQGDKLLLEVIEVLRGKARKAGDVLPVKLSQAFRITVTLTPLLRKPRPRIVRLDFVAEQGTTVQLSSTVDHTRQPLVYFFPKESAPTLTHREQIQPDRRAGWKQALTGKRPDLAFRLTLRHGSALQEEALAELFKTRDAAAISGLLDILIQPSPLVSRLWEPQFAERVLLSLGDRRGDLYERAHKLLTGAAAGRDQWTQSRLARILARADSKRALGDFRAILGKGTLAQKRGLVWALTDLESEEGLNLLFDLLGDDRLADVAFHALRELLYNAQGIAVPMARRAKLQDLAVPRLKKALEDGVLTGDLYAQAMFRGNFYELVKEAPANEPAGKYQSVKYLPYPRQGLQRPWEKPRLGQGNEELDIRLRLDLVQGRKVLEEELARRDQLPPADRAYLLFLADLYGDPDRAPARNKGAEPALLVREADTARWHKQTLAGLLKKLDATPRFSGGDAGGTIAGAFYVRLAALFPDHPGEYLKQLQGLIASEHFVERQYGIQCLEDHFYWKFDLDERDPRPALVRRVKELRPLFARLSRGSLLEMRGELLKHFGVELDGPPGKKWLPALEKAGLSWNTTIKVNALRVLGMLVGDLEVLKFAWYPPVRRERDLKAYLAPLLKGGADPQPLPAPRLQALWQDLAGNDPQTVSKAREELVEAPQSAVAFLRKQLRVLPVPDPKRCAGLIADLGSKSFKVRDRATAELKKLGEGVVPHLRRALGKQPELEMRRRLEGLLARHTVGPERLQMLRALQVLENLPGRGARDFLEELAAGPADASLTREARGALRRVSYYWQW